MSDLEKLKKLRVVIRKYEDTLAYYGKVFKDDGEIDDYEQAQLDKLGAAIIKINKEIEKRAKELNDGDKVENLYNTGVEAAADLYNTDDDIVDHSLIDNVPLSKLKSKSLDGLKVTVHSAFWTEKFLDWVMNNTDVSAEDLVREVLRINKKDYKDSDSAKHAIENYECSGSLVSVTKGSGGFELTGYTNADLGYVIKFTIHMAIKGVIELKDLEGIDIPKGMQQMGGVPGAAATFVMKYAGFGKLTRALHNYMDGSDPWTGEKGSSWRLALSGITDLATMGTGGGGALTNQAFNLLQESLENASPEQIEALGGIREVTDILTSSSPAELISNIIQGGLVTEELVNKHFPNDNQE